MNSLEIRPSFPEIVGTAKGNVVEFKERQIAEQGIKANNVDYYSSSDQENAVAAKILNFSIAQQVPMQLPNDELKGDVTPVRGFQQADSFENFDIDKVVENVVGFVSASLNNLAKNGASEDELEYYKQQAIDGVNVGVRQAKDELASVGNQTLFERVEQSQDAIITAISELSLSSPKTVVDQTESSQNQFSIASITLESGNQADVVFGASAFESDTAPNDRQLFTTNASNISFSIYGQLSIDETNLIANVINQADDVLNTFYRSDIESAYQQSADKGFDDVGLNTLALQYRATESNSSVAAYANVRKLALSEDAFADTSPKVVAEYVARMLNTAETAVEELGSEEEYNQLINGLVNEMKDVQVPDLLQAINRFHLFNAKFKL